MVMSATLGARTRSPVETVTCCLGALALAAVIFAVDTFTPLSSAVAVLYAIVILLAGGALQGRRLVVLALACAVLTLVSHVMQHGATIGGSPGLRCAISLCAIAATTWLVLRNQAASAALRSQADLLDLTHDAVFVTSPKGEINYWNRGAEQLYGWRAAEVAGARSDDLLCADPNGDMAGVMAELLRSGRWEGELMHRSRSGHELVVSSRWSLQRGEDGEPAAVLQTNTDVTERKQADAELRRAQADLAQASRLTTLGQFTATMAHEVNQPLGAIATNGEAALRFLARREPDLDEVRQALERIIVGSKRASEVVARVRARLRRTPAEHALIQISELIEEVALLIHSDLEARRISLRLDVDPAAPTVRGDRVQLQQVMINLLINAADAIGDTNPARTIGVRAGADGQGGALVQVRDSGMGIAEEHRDRLFGAFFTTKADGMGLGLAICRSTIEAHGGSIRVGRPDGPGAVIEFTLPAAEAATV